jgi:small nuclear ribonucleoprotein (snRNP)-like protein
MFTRRKRSAIGLVLAVLLALPPAALAQEATAASNDWAGLKAITAGSKLDVKLKNGKRVKGNLISFSDTALSLSDRNKTAEINREDVLSIHEMRGMTAKKATLIGAGVGGAIGASIGIAAGENGRDNCCFNITRPQGAAILGAPLAGVGALVGFIVGKSWHKRPLIYKAKQP